MKYPLTQSLHIENFSGSSVTDYSSGNTNTIVYEKDGQVFTTQRSSIDISESTSGLGLNDRGRGIYYWEENGKLYIINDDSIYATTQDSVAVDTITSGAEAVTITETIGTPYLIINDAENDEGWYMATGETVTQFSTNFPTTLAHGVLVLDGYILFMDEDGTIYNSDVDAITFSADGFLTAERENDKGVYLGKHHDHAVAFLTRSIEFFRNASNATGSPLARRQDISLSVGGVSGLAFWENGDVIYFIGSPESGQMAVYELRGFQLRMISDEGMNAYITQNITKESLSIRLSGLQMMGHDILIMTVYSLTGASPGEIVPKISFSYDAFTQRWEFFNTAVNSHTTFPLMAWTKRTGGQNATTAARSGEGIFYNGDIINVTDKLIPIDTLLGSAGIYEADIYEADIYLSSTEDSGTNISTTMRTGLKDAGFNGYKTQKSMNVEMETTDSSQTITIKKSKEKTDDFDTGVTIDTSRTRKEKRGGGRFIRCNYQLEYSGDEQFWIKALDCDLEKGL